MHQPKLLMPQYWSSSLEWLASSSSVIDKKDTRPTSAYKEFLTHRTYSFDMLRPKSQDENSPLPSAPKSTTLLSGELKPGNLQLRSSRGCRGWSGDRCASGSGCGRGGRSGGRGHGRAGGTCPACVPVSASALATCSSEKPVVRAGHPSSKHARAPFQATELDMPPLADASAKYVRSWHQYVLTMIWDGN